MKIALKTHSGSRDSTYLVALKSNLSLAKPTAVLRVRIGYVSTSHAGHPYATIAQLGPLDYKDYLLTRSIPGPLLSSKKQPQEKC